MFPEDFDFTSIEDCSSWAGLLASAAAFTGDVEFQELLAVDPDTITVGEFLNLLNEAEASLATTDFSFLSESLPFLEEQLLALFDSTTTPEGTTVEEAVNSILEFLNDLINGNLSFITESFSLIRASLEDVPLDVTLCEGFTGIGDGGTGDGGVPDINISNIFNLPGLPTLPNFGWIAGDPHLQTLDGVGYDFQAVGEYVLLQSAGAGDFMLQARMVPAGPNASANQAVATNLDGFSVMLDANDATPLHVDGQAVALNDGQSVSVGNGRVFRDGDTYVVVYPGTDGEVNDGDSQLLIRIQDGRLDIDVRLNAELMGTLEGLLGDGDGNSGNDIALVDGTVLDRPLSFADLYGPYRDDWRVDSLSESLFTYDTGESLEGFYDANFPGELITLDSLDPDIRAAAEAAAQAAGLTPGTPSYENAVLDFALTGDDSFITSALQTPLSLIGTSLADNLTGNAGADVIDGQEGNDVIIAAAGNDVITGGTDNDIINGGAGMDTAVYSGNQASYTLTLSPTSTTIEDRRADGNGTDELIDVENLSFADGDFNLDVRTGAADLPAEDFAAIVELYIAYFDRAPASKGLLYWGDRLADGMTLPEIADSFFNQQEIQTTYSAYLNADGSLADTQAFVSAVFNNVLGRDPSGPYWANELETNPGMTPAIFILAVLNGAKAATGSALDAAYLADKTDIGVYFSAIKGLSDYDDTIAVMELYDGSQASIDDAVTAIDAIHAEALNPNSGEFLIELVGVADDPFAGV